ncbi:TraK family protein [Methylomonas sp. LWB]|uniref:TraK family protein n=1 Tax=Methylomonas sp. LWB TaxID=1905845 RepID=UPI0026748FCD|nr:TraK family protein [Methylomonas sp. LWB]
MAQRQLELNKKTGSGNRAIFLTLRAEIKEALDDGWAVVQIYRTLHEEGKIDFSYQAFRLYVNKLILNPGQTHRKPKDNKPKQQDGMPEPATAKQEADKPKGFVWNPNYSKEDLF